MFFIKKDSALGESKWTTVMVLESLDKGMDGVIGEAVIKFCNSSEQVLSLGKDDSQHKSYYPRYTERLIKIFSVEHWTAVNAFQPSADSTVQVTRTSPYIPRASVQ